MAFKSAWRSWEAAAVLLALLSVFMIAFGRPALHAVRPHAHGPHGMHRSFLYAEASDGRDVEFFESMTWRAIPTAVPPLLLSLALVVLRMRRRALRLDTPHFRKLLPPPEPAAPSD